MCNIKYGREFINNNNFINNFDKYYTELQKVLLKFTNRIVILNDNPHLLTSPYNCLNNKNVSNCYCTLGINCTISNLPLYNHMKIEKCDINKYLCKNSKCNYIINNRIVYVDKHHLTPYITQYLAKYLIQCLKVNDQKKNKCIVNNTKRCMYYMLK